jgi:hypothetical protein
MNVRRLVVQVKGLGFFAGDLVQWCGELAPLGVRDPTPLRGQHLYGDVVRTRIEVLTDSADHRVGVAPGHEGVDEGVGAPVGCEVVVGESEVPEVVHVVGLGEVSAGVGLAHPARLRRVGFQQHRLFRAQKWADAEDRRR